MTISNHLPSVYAEELRSIEKDSAQQRLSAAEETADKLEFPDWRQIANDGIYRCGYVVMLRTKALQWKVEATKEAAFKTWRYSEALGTLFVQIYVPGQIDSCHLRGEIRSEQSHAAIDIIGNGNSLQVGQYLDTLGEEWANWRLLSLEVAEEPGF